MLFLLDSFPRYNQLEYNSRSAVQLIADYYAFASPSVTGQWRVQVEGNAWQLGFRGGELVSFDPPELEGDLLSFLHDISALSDSNLSVLRSFRSSGRETDQVLAELVGGSEELLGLRRKHALHAIGRLLCRDATRADFSDLAPQSSSVLGVEALALPYIAFRLQPPEALRSALEPYLARCYRLSRNPKIPVAGLQLDKEALSVAKEFTKPKVLQSVLNGLVGGSETVVAYATFLTLLGCEMLCEAEQSDEIAAPSEAPSAPPVERIRPPSMMGGTRLGGDGFERVSAGISPPITPDEMPRIQANTEGFERAPTGEAPPIAEEEAAPFDTQSLADEGPGLGQTDATIALFLDAIDSRLLTDAETMADRLEVSPDQRSVLMDYLAANDPRGTDPGAAMTSALAGLQEFTERHPDDHLGPLLLSRIYNGADNPALAKVFAQQAQRLGGHTEEVVQWKVD